MSEEKVGPAETPVPQEQEPGVPERAVGQPEVTAAETAPVAEQNLVEVTADAAFEAVREDAEEAAAEETVGEAPDVAAADDAPAATTDADHGAPATPNADDAAPAATDGVAEPAVEAANEAVDAAATDADDAAPAATDGVAEPAVEAAGEVVDAAATDADDAAPAVTDGVAEPAVEAADEAAAEVGEAGPDEEETYLVAEVTETVNADELVHEAASGSDTDRLELKAILEAVIYITDEPLTAQQMATAIDRPLDLIKELLEELTEDYALPERGLTIREIAGGYKMATKPEHHEAVRAFVKNLKPPLKLSLAALETLAVIAYKQPVTGPEIMEIRGVQGLGVLKTLMDRKLIATAGRKNVVGKPILYKTTKEFLVQFGLKDLAELPTLKEFEELGRLALSEGEPEQAAAAPPAPEPPLQEPPEEIPPAEEPPRDVPPEEDPSNDPPREDPGGEPPVQEPETEAGGEDQQTSASEQNA